MGKAVKYATAALVGGPIGLTAYAAYDKGVKEPMEAQKKAIAEQTRQQQALIDEQKNAEATAKAQAIAMRKAEIAGRTQTKYATVLGKDSDEDNSSKKKKSVLGG
jgi:hypothetical protein